MTVPLDNKAAVVVLPAVSAGRLQDESLQGWLSRGVVTRAPERRDLHDSVVESTGVTLPAQGRAALRMWGQTSERPTVWMAAADPVYLEPRLDRLCLHALGGEAVSVADMRSIFDGLQERLADGSAVGFARVGRLGYLRAEAPIATAERPAAYVDGQDPAAFLPRSEGAAKFRNLVSEIEMLLHDHEANARRAQAGLPPVNSLWIWGGGYAPEAGSADLPPLYAADPLLRGYWLSHAAPVADWPGTIQRCLDDAQRGFVAVPPVPVGDSDALHLYLRELREAMRERRLQRLVLFFRDGIEVRLQRGDDLRIWRRTSALLR